jgi:Tfp pilus assembly protein PilP
MARKGKLSPFKKFMIVAGVLLVAQGIFLLAFKTPEPVPIREAISRKVDSVDGVSNTERTRMKIQLAIQDFMMKNAMRLPTKLEELVPTYFDVVPVDPATNERFAYRVDGQRFYVGEAKSAQGESSEPGSKAEEALLIASLDQPDQGANFVYDPSGKRDPFRSFNFAPPTDANAGKSQLETYDLGQLKLTAVLEGFDEPMAFVENAVGKGFPVKKGTKIGTGGGVIVDILKDRLLILETSTDFTGANRQRTVEMKIRTKDLEPEKTQ